MYICDGCEKTGDDFSFYCRRCDFDLHPHCALEDGYEVVDSEKEDEVEAWPKKVKHKLHKHVLVKAERDGNSYEESDDSEEGKEHDDYNKNEGNEVEHESPDSLHFKKASELEDDEEEAEDNSKKILGDESGDKKEGEDTDEDNKNEEDSEGDGEQ
ncbi:hypothetical protein HPP92_016232 [Vanilla planifolia]|uniref:DC1 domain-containing protein n=1 Tax=Vanilla planifolia TaxID=51239 RepID=A0A835QID4_VANPL|nr:hypothetical protein HPP92_016232 [Vanilla planifolia]